MIKSSHHILNESLLDRLIDHEPDKTHESNKTQQQQLSDFYISIHRDLENLLNTRNLNLFDDTNCKNLNFSILNYGLPDLFNHPHSLNDQTEFVRKLRNIIETFEPRIKNIELSIVHNDDLTEKILRFRITGWLHIEPTPALITLNSTLNPENYFFQLTSA